MITKEKIRFISYTGAFPNLCSGVLTLEIDGTPVSFGHSYMKPEPDYQAFWHSGGCCTFGGNGDEIVERAPWKIFKEDLPTQYQEYAEIITELFNKNVPHGCCGGCI